MITPRPPMLGHDTVKVTRQEPKITIEGKWAAIRNIVQQLADDGYKHETPDVTEWHGERLSVVEMTR